MERLRSMTVAAALAALAGGCVHVHTDADGKLKSVGLKAEPDGGVQQASATVPAAAVPAAASGLTKIAAKVPGFGGGPPASNLLVTLQTRVAQLPDPTSNGQFKPGLVGQMFLVGGPKMGHVAADGKVTVELFDASPRVGHEPVRLGGWTFEKDVLNQLVTTDERFGKCYALFLPWPTYTPAVTRVKMMAKYEPAQGHAIYAEPMTMTIDTTGGAAEARAPIVLSHSTGGAPTASPALPIPPSGPAAPAGLPPLSITMPGR